MGNNVVTRFPGGVTNVGQDAIFADLLQTDPTEYHLYFEDFDTYTAGDWVVTETDASATQALTAGDGGLLLLTNTAADNDLIALQKTPASFTFTAGKASFFSCRFKVSDATQSDVAIGMQVMVLVFIVIIIGGLGSVGGCFVGALMVGLMANYAGFLAPKVALVSNILLMVIILLWRPQGLYPVSKR